MWRGKRLNIHHVQLWLKWWYHYLRPYKFYKSYFVLLWVRWNFSSSLERSMFISVTCSGTAWSCMKIQMLQHTSQKLLHISTSLRGTREHRQVLTWHSSNSEFLLLRTEMCVWVLGDIVGLVFQEKKNSVGDMFFHYDEGTFCTSIWIWAHSTAKSVIESYMIMLLRWGEKADLSLNTSEVFFALRTIWK